jgi:hypothetical protein
MAERKTRPTAESAKRFLNGIADERRRRDCFRLLEIMTAATKCEPEMWGTSIVGFGRHNYKYESGTKGEWFLTGFSPRKQELTLYLMGGSERHPDMLKKLGKHKTGRACLYIKRLDDIDLPTLKQLIKRCVADIAKLKR